MNKKLNAKIISTGMVMTTLVTGVAQAQETAQGNTNIEKSEKTAQPKSRKEIKTSSTTYSQLADFLLQSAKSYNSNIDKKKIMSGYENKENQKVNRLDGLIMISRAFGTLSAPKGQNERVAEKNVSFTDIPASAKSDIDNLINGGVMVNTKDKKLHGSDVMTVGEVDTMVRRIWAFKGSNPKDDFYNFVNKKALEESKLPSDETVSGGYVDIENENTKKINDIIKKIVEGNHKKGSEEQKIKDFYLNILDMKSRNELGNKPIKKYLDAIDKAKNVKELSDIQKKSLEEIGTGGSVGLFLMKDNVDEAKYALYIGTMADTHLFSSYSNDETIENSKTFFKKLLILSGESEAQASKHVDEYINFVKKVSGGEEGVDKRMTLKEIEEKMPNLELSKTLTAAGYTNLPKEIKVMNPKDLELFNKAYTNNNLEALKTLFKIKLSEENAQFLDQKYLNVWTDNANPGADASQSKITKKDAAALTSEKFSSYIGKLFVEKYFPEKSKKDVEDMVKSFVELYKERIKKLDWMSETTKKEAIKKLDKMTFVVGYPDKWESDAENVDIKSKEDGGNHFDNITAFKLARLKKDAENTGKVIPKDRFGLATFTVNAVYGMYDNAMTFPAGILQAPLYDPNASREENLGAIGAVIGHEISHAFDNNGAKYDSSGKEHDWWTKDDYREFQERCNDVVNFYDGWEIAPGVKANGKISLGENIADIGGVGAALGILSKMENPNYDKFFKSYAESYIRLYTREYAKNSTGDEHSPNTLRVNRVLSNFEEFYKTYNITKNDGMYVAPEDRVNLWDNLDTNVKSKKMTGDDRFETAVKVSKEGWKTSNTVILVNGTDKHLVDGLSATPLANTKNAPMLLSNGSNVDKSTMDEIKRLKASNIIVVGGEASISNSVVNQLKGVNKSMNVKRIGGKSRYETSLNIAKEMSGNNNIDTIYVSAGDGEADALSISSVAGKNNSPIILTQKDGLDKDAYDYIKSKKVKTSYFIGGETKISQKAIEQINNITSNDVSKNRIAGNDRQETNARVIERFYKDNSINGVILAKENNLIDALSVGPFASKENMPVVIATNSLNKEQENILDKKSSEKVYQVGGGIKLSVLNKLRLLLNK